MLDADDRARLEPPAARRLDHPALQPGGDVLLDAGGGHPAVEDQRLDRRALEDRQDVDRDRVGRQGAEHDERQRHDRHGDRVLERGADQTIHGRARLRQRSLQGPTRSSRRGRMSPPGGDGASCRRSAVPDLGDDRASRPRAGCWSGARPRSSGPSPETTSTRVPLSAPSSTFTRRTLPSRTTWTTPCPLPERSRTQADGHRQIASSRPRARCVARPYIPSRSRPSGLGRSISTRIVRVVVVLRLGDPRDGRRGTSGPPGASMVTTAGSPGVGQDDVAVGDPDDDPHQVGPRDRQQAELAAVGGRADEGPGVEVRGA